MQVMRTIIWVTVLILVLLFILFNVGNSADLNIWPKIGEDQPVIVSGPMWAFALAFFLLGLVPMWLLYRAQAWRLKRRIASLENSLRAASTVTPVENSGPAPAAASGPTPLDSPGPTATADESRPSDVS